MPVAVACPDKFRGTLSAPEAAAAIGRMGRLFDDAVRSGVDPLLAKRADAAAEARPARRGGKS